MKKKYEHVIIGLSFEEDGANEMIDVLGCRLNDGWEILRADCTKGSFVYILRRPIKDGKKE